MIQNVPKAYHLTKNNPLIAQGVILIFTDKINDYSMIVATRPEPTVLPPSRIANVRPCSIAIG